MTASPKDSYCAIPSVAKALFSLAEDVQAEVISVSHLKNTHWGTNNVSVEKKVSSPSVATAALTFEIVVVVLFIYSFCSCTGLPRAVQEDFSDSRHKRYPRVSRAGPLRNKSEEFLEKKICILGIMMMWSVAGLSCVFVVLFCERNCLTTMQKQMINVNTVRIRLAHQV